MVRQKKKSTLFGCQCIKYESTNWGHYFLRLLLETGSPFYVVIRATRSSTRLQGKGITFISQLFFKTLSIGPAPGIEPASSRSAVKRSTD